MASWYFQLDGTQVGPMTSSDLKRHVVAGRIHPTTLVRKGEDGKWYPARKVQGLLLTDLADEAPVSVKLHCRLLPVPSVLTDLAAEAPVSVAGQSGTEIVCGQCHGRMTVSTLGIVAACPHCGTQLSVAAPNESPAASRPNKNLMPCPDCNHLVSYRAESCPSCGCLLDELDEWDELDKPTHTHFSYPSSNASRQSSPVARQSTGGVNFITAHDVNGDGTPDLFVMHNTQQIGRDIEGFISDISTSSPKDLALMFGFFVLLLTPVSIILYFAAFQSEDLEWFCKSMGWLPQDL